MRPPHPTPTPTARTQPRNHPHATATAMTAPPDTPAVRLTQRRSCPASPKQRATTPRAEGNAHTLMPPPLNTKFSHCGTSPALFLSCGGNNLGPRPPTPHRGCGTRDSSRTLPLLLGPRLTLPSTSLLPVLRYLISPDPPPHPKQLQRAPTSPALSLSVFPEPPPAPLFPPTSPLRGEVHGTDHHDAGFAAGA